MKNAGSGEQAAAAVNARADRALPSDITNSVLSLLPVKFIHRFKAVCKPWRDLFATPNFIKLHYARFSQNPANQNLIIYSTNVTHTISLFRMDSDARIPTDLVHPYPLYLFQIDLVGCHAGLVCLSLPFYEWIHLWNPALNLVKRVKFPLTSPDELGDVWRSVGFGYDEITHEFMVVRIGGDRRKKFLSAVYSTKTESWKKFKILEWKLGFIPTKCNALVGGNPYWVVRVEDGSNWCDDTISHILCFDVTTSMFKTWHSSNKVLGNDNGYCMPLMDWEGSLATITWRKLGEEGSGYVEVCLFHKDTSMWNVAHLLGPFQMDVDKILQCSKNGEKIFGSFSNGKLFVLDVRTGHVKEIEVKKGVNMFEYSEGLVSLDGMMPVEVEMNLL